MLPVGGNSSKFEPHMALPLSAEIQDFKLMRFELE
jgi:hypothetical protein